MDRRLTRAERRVCAIALPIALALGCSNVELVGVDRASVTEDAGTGEAADAASTEPAHDGAVNFDRDAALPTWTDPVQPAARPNQFVDAKLCPAAEPAQGALCQVDGLQCDYPVCWGGGSRSWLCSDRRFALWFDESFLCAAQRPCPANLPSEGASCALAIECLYPYSCCKGPTGFAPVRCDGRWHLGKPYCGGCPATLP
jgi:hypothetical protein